ncbi:MAG: HDIG domain-containing protein [Vicinamibacteria bacterium]|jgi:putative nucleotidyltransferase with HDIG domain|nr:HDIG domain-containing protein [Vicinamibacteria bacterium]
MPDTPAFDRARAEQLLFEFTKSAALRQHARAVEAGLRAYAAWFGVTDPAEVERWGVIGLIHDFDYEQNPTAETHVHAGMRILRERGWPEEIVLAMASHADYMDIPRDTPVKRALYACDEMAGFLGACVKVRPSRSIADLPVESVLKKLKDRAFARAVDRAAVAAGAEAVGRPLAEHIAFLIAALIPVAEEVGM